MTDTVDIQEREAFVVYTPGRGFVKNKNRDYTEDFAYARIYGFSKDAEDSIHKGKLDAIVIPIRMSIDPRKIFTAILKGT